MEQLGLPLVAARAERRPPSQRPVAALARLARALAARLGAGRRLARVAVVFNPRLRSAAGRADGRARTIELNPRLLDRHPGELLPTLGHELCHLVAGVRDGHGPRWRAAMAALGLRPEVCHRLDVGGISARRRTWLWTCAGCGETYRRRHRGARRFRCGRCGRRLELAGAADGAPALPS